MSIPVFYSPEHLTHEPGLEIVYGLSQDHPESPVRGEEILKALKSWEKAEIKTPTAHGREPITVVHDPGMVEFLAAAWEKFQGALVQKDVFPDTVLHPALREGMDAAPKPRETASAMGYWCFETNTPLTKGTYPAARAAVDCALSAADAVNGGERLAYALCRPPGHHAARAVYGGYCYFNNAAIAANFLAQKNDGKVAVLDVDYHHGNGTQQIFYAREDVFFCSLHADPHRAYPYFIGHADETGTGVGLGKNLNFPMRERVGDEEYLQTLEKALAAIQSYTPDFLVVSLGIDTFKDDPLGDFEISTPGLKRQGELVKSLDLPTLVVQEGGYFLPALGQNVRVWLEGVSG